MGLLETLSNKANASDAATMLRTLLVAAGAKPEEIDIQVNPKTGSVTFEGHEFTFENGLRLIGYCQQCRMEVPSRVFNSVGEIGPLLRDFRPMRHQCMDVD